MQVLLNSLLNQKVRIKTHANEDILGTLDSFTEEFLKLTSVEFKDETMTTKPSAAYVPMTMVRLLFPVEGKFMMLIE